MIRWTRESDSPFPQIEVIVFIPGLTSAAQFVAFRIDTGATNTLIHPGTAVERLHIPRSSLDSSVWASVQVMSGINGEARYGVFDAVYGFVHEDGSLTQIDGQVHLAEETDYNWDVPSLLGWDLLERFEMHALGREWMTLQPL